MGLVAHLVGLPPPRSSQQRRAPAKGSAAWVVWVVAGVLSAVPRADGAVPVTAHSHFRHGTISWEPGKVANEAIFTVNAAFRKEFNWGAYNKEQWRDTRAGDAWSSALDTQTLPCYDPAAFASRNPNIQCFEQLSFIDFAGNYQLRFPVGLGTSGHDLIPNSDGKDAWMFNASVGHKTRDLNVAASAENAGGSLCKCRFHKGVSQNDIECRSRIPWEPNPMVSPFAQASSAQIDRPQFLLGTVATVRPVAAVEANLSPAYTQKKAATSQAPATGPPA